MSLEPNNLKNNLHIRNLKILLFFHSYQREEVCDGITQP